MSSWMCLLLCREKSILGIEAVSTTRPGWRVPLSARDLGSWGWGEGGRWTESATVVP